MVRSKNSVLNGLTDLPFLVSGSMHDVIIFCNSNHGALYRDTRPLMDLDLVVARCYASWEIED